MSYKLIRKFLIKLLVVALLLMMLTPLVVEKAKWTITPYWPWIIVLLTVVSIVVYCLVWKFKSKNDHKKFANFYMILSIVRPMTYLAILLVYALCNKHDGKRFMVTFLVFYLIFTVFETIQLSKKDSKEKKEDA